MSDDDKKWNANLYGGVDYETWGGWNSQKASIPLTKTCTCGTLITMGHDVPLEMHSDWCDLVRKDDSSKDS